MLCWLCEAILRKDRHISKFTAVLFTIAKTRKQPRCSLIEKWIEKIWYIYIHTYPFIFQWTFILFFFPVDIQIVSACICAKLLQACPTFSTLWIIAHQAPPSMGFSGQEYWNGLPCHPSGDIPNPVMEMVSLSLLHWQAGSLSYVPLGKPLDCFCILANIRHFQM